MRPVVQQERWRPPDHPDGPQRGDCLRACVASILDLALEDVPDPEGRVSNIAQWVAGRMPGVTVSERYLKDLGERETLDSWRDWPTSHYEPGFWIGCVHSPRIPDRETFGCGCASRVPGGDPSCRWCHGRPAERSMGITWGLHAVVMRGGALAWDPFPGADQAPASLSFKSAVRFIVEDPARVAAAYKGLEAIA